MGNETFLLIAQYRKVVQYCCRMSTSPEGQHSSAVANFSVTMIVVRIDVLHNAHSPRLNTHPVSGFNDTLQLKGL